MKNIAFDCSSAKITGRNYSKNNILYLLHSGSGAEFDFFGKELFITVGCDADSLSGGRVCNYPRIAVLVDGRPIVRKVVSKAGERYKVICTDEASKHRVSIIKLSEAAFSIALLYEAETDDNAVMTPTEEKKLKIEFIGDSITCGFGVDDNNVEGDFSTAAENFMKSYAYLTASQLDADYSVFSYSGYGLISGYTADGVRNTDEILPQYYESLGYSHCSADGVRMQELPWDFSCFSPDIIVINLGTNDNSFCIKNEGAFDELEKEYLRFIGTVRKNSPQAKIICAIGLIDVETSESVKKAAESFGGENVYTFFFRPQDGLLGYGAQWHPSEDTHSYAADELSDFIRSIVSE
ncbi:MAG: hypothetical protein IJJ57_11250 [Ruminococcus sp.]|nr:hypothetical protein [Ruminococcus sp.]